MMSSPDFWILTTWLENEFLLHSKRPRLDEATQLKWRNVAFYRILIKAFTLNFIVGYLKKTAKTRELCFFKEEKKG